jgi:hypothetical protein
MRFQDQQIGAETLSDHTPLKLVKHQLDWPGSIIEPACVCQDVSESRYGAIWIGGFDEQARLLSL